MAAVIAVRHVVELQQKQWMHVIDASVKTLDVMVFPRTVSYIY
jgi:hypothetical protein